MNVRRIGFVITLSAVLPACGSEGATTMSNYTTDMDRHVDALRVEQTAHSTEIANAQDVTAMDQPEMAHWQRTRDHMGMMDMVIGDMMSCTDSRGNRLDYASFSATMQSMRAECDRHRDAMHDLPDLATRRAEEARRQEAMKSCLDQMQGAVGTMMSTGNDYSCGHCTHCGM